MYRKRKIAVVMPAYNEEKLIGQTLSGIPGFVDKIYVIDDCSKDGTAQVVKQFQQKNKKIILRSHEQNKGVGAAIISGYKKALKDGIDVVAVMDGDNQMDPEQLHRILDPVIDGKADYSKGDRLSRREHKIGMSMWRRFGNFLLSVLTKISSGYWHVHDPQNAYTAISINALRKINLDEIYTYYGYLNDLLAKMNVLGIKVCNVDMPARYGEEKSTIRYSTYIRKVSLLLFRNFLWRLRVKYF
jgi:glycosyltransferase involved in cell wall biosynthesis